MPVSSFKPPLYDVAKPYRFRGEMHGCRSNLNLTFVPRFIDNVASSGSPTLSNATLMVLWREEYPLGFGCLCNPSSVRTPSETSCALFAARDNTPRLQLSTRVPPSPRTSRLKTLDPPRRFRPASGCGVKMSRLVNRALPLAFVHLE